METLVLPRSTYRGQQFLQLVDTKGNLIKPSYLASGSWLSQVKRTDPPSLTARMTRAILGHAPIGEYFRRFNIDEPHGCSCDRRAFADARSCFVSMSPQGPRRSLGARVLLPTLLKFLRAHPWAFASGPRDGVDDVVGL